MVTVTRDEWPAYYGTDVPPVDAVDAGGHVFRMVRCIPPERADFRSTYEDDLARNNNRRNGAWEEICAVSFFTSLDAIRKTRNRYRPLRNRKIAEGPLLPYYGKMKLTGQDNHLSVWLKRTAVPETTVCCDAELRNFGTAP